MKSPIVRGIATGVVVWAVTHIVGQLVLHFPFWPTFYAAVIAIFVAEVAVAYPKEPAVWFFSMLGICYLVVHVILGLPERLSMILALFGWLVILVANKRLFKKPTNQKDKNQKETEDQKKPQEETQKEETQKEAEKETQTQGKEQGKKRCTKKKKKRKRKRKKRKKGNRK